MLFPLNPADHAVASILSGSYSRDGIAGLITEGPAWWWCDHRYGIEQMLENFAASGVLWNFVEMTTDSRSFPSLVRHDYFRRVLCSWLSRQVRENILPREETLLGELIRKTCYRNAHDIFDIKQ